MKMMMRFMSDNGEIFSDAKSAAIADHLERVRNVARKIIRERTISRNIITQKVDELVDYLLDMEKIGLPLIGSEIEESREKAEKDAAEFLPQRSEKDDEC